jgi:hypothetical protein
LQIVLRKRAQIQTHWRESSHEVHRADPGRLPLAIAMKPDQVQKGARDPGENAEEVLG